MQRVKGVSGALECCVCDTVGGKVLIWLLLAPSVTVNSSVEDDYSRRTDSSKMSMPRSAASLAASNVMPTLSSSMPSGIHGAISVAQEEGHDYTKELGMTLDSGLSEYGSSGEGEVIPPNSGV